MAEKLKIDTTQPGDVYLVREAETAFNPTRGTVDIQGYSYSSERALTKKQVREDEELAKGTLSKLVLDSPIVIKNQR